MAKRLGKRPARQIRAGRHRQINFRTIADSAVPALPAIVKRWLPDGHRRGNEWVARNPTRMDRNPGSFSINLTTGRWGDFATGDRGGDAISLAAYVFGLNQGEAARRIANMLGIGETGR